MKIVIWIIACIIFAAAAFVGGLLVGTQIINQFTDADLIELADSYESRIGKLRNEHRREIELFKRANKYLELSIVNRNKQLESDNRRIKGLEKTVTRLQIGVRTSLDSLGDFKRTIQRIKEATYSIGEDVQGIRNNFLRVPE